MGWVSGDLPRMHAVQAAGSAPVVRAFQAGAEFPEPVKPDTIAKSIAIGNPADGYHVLQTLRETGGTATMVSDEEILQSVTLLAETEGIFTEPAGGATLAGAVALIKSGAIPPDEPVVVCITGNGYKTSDVMQGRTEAPVHLGKGLAEFEDYLAAKVVGRGLPVAEAVAGSRASRVLQSYVPQNRTSKDPRHRPLIAARRVLVQLDAAGPHVEARIAAQAQPADEPAGTAHEEILHAAAAVEHRAGVVGQHLLFIELPQVACAPGDKWQRAAAGKRQRIQMPHRRRLDEVGVEVLRHRDVRYALHVGRDLRFQRGAGPDEPAFDGQGARDVERQPPVEANAGAEVRRGAEQGGVRRRTTDLRQGWPWPTRSPLLRRR